MKGNILADGTVFLSNVPANEQEYTASIRLHRVHFVFRLSKENLESFEGYWFGSMVLSTRGLSELLRQLEELGPIATEIIDGLIALIEANRPRLPEGLPELSRETLREIVRILEEQHFILTLGDLMGSIALDAFIRNMKVPEFIKTILLAIDISDLLPPIGGMLKAAPAY